MTMDSSIDPNVDIVFITIISFALGRDFFLRAIALFSSKSGTFITSRIDVH